MKHTCLKEGPSCCIGCRLAINQLAIMYISQLIYLSSSFRLLPLIKGIPGGKSCRRDYIWSRHLKSFLEVPSRRHLPCSENSNHVNLLCLEYIHDLSTKIQNIDYLTLNSWNLENPMTIHGEPSPWRKKPKFVGPRLDFEGSLYKHYGLIEPPINLDLDDNVARRTEEILCDMYEQTYSLLRRHSAALVKTVKVEICFLLLLPILTICCRSFQPIKFSLIVYYYAGSSG